MVLRFRRAKMICALPYVLFLAFASYFAVCLKLRMREGTQTWLVCNGGARHLVCEAEARAIVTISRIELYDIMAQHDCSQRIAYFSYKHILLNYFPSVISELAWWTNSMAATAC